MLGGRRKGRSASLLVAGPALVLAATVVAAGCSRTGDIPLPGPRVPDASEPPITVSSRPITPGLLPSEVVDPEATRVTALLFRGLVRLDPKGKTVLEAADRIETDDDRVFRVTLKEGWTFSNGEAVTATSFADAWTMAAGSGQRRPRNSYQFADIEGYAQGRLTGVQVTGPREFTVTLTAAQPGFIARLAHPAFAPLPSQALRDRNGFARAPIGNGPYQLDPAGSGPQQIILRPNASYPGTDKPQNNGLVLRTYTDPVRAYQDLLAGRLDVADTVPISALPSYRQVLRSRSVNQPVGMAQSIVFPMSQPEWRRAPGRRLRIAISQAIDRERLASGLFLDTRRASSDLTAPVVEGYSPGLCGPACRYEPDQAGVTLSDAVAPEGGLRIGYAADSDDLVWLSALCATLSQELRLACTPVAYPSQAALTEAIARRTVRIPVVATTRMTVADISGFLHSRFDLASPVNDSQYPDRRTQTMLRAAAALPTGQSRITAYQDVERRILGDLPVIPLWSLNATGGWGTGVKEVKTDVFGVPVFTEITRP